MRIGYVGLRQTAGERTDLESSVILLTPTNRNFPFWTPTQPRVGSDDVERMYFATDFLLMQRKKDVK